MDSQQIQNESQESPRSTIIQRTAHDHNFTFENKENMTALSENEPKTKESNFKPTKGPDHRTTAKSWSADSCRGLSTHSYHFYFIATLLNFVPRFIQSFGLSSTTNALSRLLQLISGARGFTALSYRLDSWSCHFGRKVATNNLCSNVSIDHYHLPGVPNVHRKLLQFFLFPYLRKSVAFRSGGGQRRSNYAWMSFSAFCQIVIIKLYLYLSFQ